MTNDEINSLVDTIGNVVTNVGGATASVIGALNGGSGRVNGGSTTYVYGNSGDTSSLPTWLMPLGIVVLAIGGVILLIKNFK